MVDDIVQTLLMDILYLKAEKHITQVAVNRILDIFNRCPLVTLTDEQRLLMPKSYAHAIRITLDQHIVWKKVYTVSLYPSYHAHIHQC